MATLILNRQGFAVEEGERYERLTKHQARERFGHDRVRHMGTQRRFLRVDSVRMEIEKE